MPILNPRVVNLRKDKFIRVRLPLFVIAFIIFLDQVSKARFATSCNTGIAFGLFRDVGVLNTITPVFVIGLCLYFFLKSNNKIVSLALSLIIAGGLANLVDRLMFGCVRDFVDFGFWPSQTWLSSSLTRWPSFNLADSAISVGVGLLLVFLYIRPKV